MRKNNGRTSPSPAAAGPGRTTLAAALSVALALAACSDGGGGSSLGPLTIVTAPVLSAAGPITLDITLPPNDLSSTSLRFVTADLGSATGLATGGPSCSTPGTDYVAVADGVAPVLGNKTSMSIVICPNASFEPNETFEIRIPWQGGTTRVLATILNDQPGGLTDTGLTQCLNTANALVACSASDLKGQDGSFGRDTQPATSGGGDGRLGFAYASLAGGCVDDRVSGLVWDGTAPTAATLADAQAELATANRDARCGFTDWRLPATAELLSLVDAGAAAPPRIDARFAGTPGAAFWTGEPYAGDPRASWVVDFVSGAVAFEPVANPLAKPLAVRLVRGGTATAAPACDAADPRWVDHGNGTVTDSRTGLMWQQCTDGLSGAGCATGTATAHASFAAALQRAAAVNGDSAGAGKGFGDWRVPNRNELASLAHHGCEAPSVARTPFPATQAASYWTSSPAGAGRAWYVDFSDGGMGLSGTGGSRYLRLVRAGQ